LIEKQKMTGPSIGKGQEKKKPFFILLFTEVTFFGFFFLSQGLD